EGGGPGQWRQEPGHPAEAWCGAGWKEAVAAAAGALQAGGLVAVPTDTVYGVACLAQDSAAVRSIYSLKGRNGAKPLAICLGDVERLYRCSRSPRRAAPSLADPEPHGRDGRAVPELPELQWPGWHRVHTLIPLSLPCRYCHVNVPDELLQDLLPGPVTLVLKRSEELNKDLNPFTSLVGVRIPDHPFMRDLARACPGPLALTSANISSQGSTLTVLGCHWSSWAEPQALSVELSFSNKPREFQDLWPQLSLVIDGGPIGDTQSPECRLGSTVVDLSVSGKFSIIRPG
ncbi:YrdC domain-containing protein, partial [Lamprotornis superbus]